MTAPTREDLLAKAAQDFIDKVDRGEARSSQSYAAFKAALDHGLAQQPAFTIDLRSALQLLDSLDRIAEDFRKVQPCRHNNDNVISELKIELAGLREVLATPQQSPRLERAPAYCGDPRKIEVSMAAWDGIVHYIKALHKERAVDDAKMQRAAYFPIEHCMTLWGITPYKIQHDTTVVSSTSRVGLLDPGIDGPYNEPCEHKSVHDGPRVELVYGTAPTQVCDCGAWRTMHHKPGLWQTTPLPSTDWLKGLNDYHDHHPLTSKSGESK